MQSTMTSTEINDISIPYILYQDANRITLRGVETQTAFKTLVLVLPVWGTVNQSNANVPIGVTVTKLLLSLPINRVMYCNGVLIFT